MALHDDDTKAVASLESVLAELRRGQAVPCYLLQGDEEFRLRDGLDKITAALIPDALDRELNLFMIDGEREHVGAICDALITPPLLPGRKVIVVRDTRLFQSKNLMAPLITRIRERLNADPDRAAADFMQFLTLTGMQLEDLRDSGWRRIDDESWRRMVPDDGGVDRESWLPNAVELCISRGTVASPEKTEDETDRLEQVLSEGMPEGNHLILTAVTVDRRKRLFKIVSALGRVLNFTKIKSENRQKQAVMEMAAGILGSRGKRLTADAWNALGQKTGFGLRESIGEIEKLIDYTGGKAVIDAVDVEEVAGQTKEETVFDLTGALAARNLQAAIRALRDLLDQETPPFMILARIAKDIRFLLHAHLLLASGRLKSFDAGMDYGRFQKAVYPSLKPKGGEEHQVELVSQHPYVIYQALKNTGRFSRRELAGFLERLAETDLAIKSTGQDPRTLLERFLLAVCR